MMSAMTETAMTVHRTEVEQSRCRRGELKGKMTQYCALIYLKTFLAFSPFLRISRTAVPVLLVCRPVAGRPQPNSHFATAQTGRRRRRRGGRCSLSSSFSIHPDRRAPYGAVRRPLPQALQRGGDGPLDGGDGEARAHDHRHLIILVLLSSPHRQPIPRLRKRRDDGDDGVGLLSPPPSSSTTTTTTRACRPWLAASSLPESAEAASECYRDGVSLAARESLMLVLGGGRAALLLLLHRGVDADGGEPGERI